MHESVPNTYLEVLILFYHYYAYATKNFPVSRFSTTWTSLEVTTAAYLGSTL